MQKSKCIVMDLSIEIRITTGLLLICFILLIGITTLYFSKTNELQQATNSFNQSMKTIETYCDINQINETIRQDNLNKLTTANWLE